MGSENLDAPTIYWLLDLLIKAMTNNTNSLSGTMVPNLFLQYAKLDLLYVKQANAKSKL